jgi:hypothetical protein
MEMRVGRRRPQSFWLESKGVCSALNMMLNLAH